VTPGGRFREVRRGAPDELVPLEAAETSIWVSEVISEAAWGTIGQLLADRTDVSLRVSAGEDLEWLRFTPELRSLTAESLRLRSVEGLRLVAETLDSLTLGDTLKRVSLRPLAELQQLRQLGVNGTWNDIDTLGSLVGLERLGIGSVDVADLQPLQSLRRFTSGLGTVRSLELLPEIGALELVELYRLRGEHDLSSLARIPKLTYLVLESTRSVTSLPSFAGSPELRWVALDAMLGITDLRPVAAAPNLEVLLLVGMCKLRMEDLRPLVGHPSLRAGIWGLCSERRNRQARELLPLPPAPGEATPWTEPEWTGVRHPAHT
jgi:hypothetical protein